MWPCRGLGSELLFGAFKWRAEGLSGTGPRVGRSGTGALLGERRRVGRFWTMGFEPGLFVRPPLRLARIEPRARIGLCRCPAASHAGDELRGLDVMIALSRMIVHAIGLDVHRDFC